MFGRIAVFEFRYHIKNPLFIAAAGAFFAAAFVDMAVKKIVTPGGGSVLYNSPHAVIVSHLLVSVVFLFVGAALVSDVVLRDDQTGFGPLVRTTYVTKFDYLFGRLLGALAVGAIIMATVTVGAWIGTLMPFADQDMLGPNRFYAYLYGYGVFALPNALIISATLFALATITRSTAGTFVGVIGLLILYVVGQRLMEGQPQLLHLRALADPFGMLSYMGGARYLTAAELNAGIVPVTKLLLLGRLLWIGVAIALLAITYRLFRFTDRGTSRLRWRREAIASTAAPAVPAVPAVPGVTAPFARLAEPRFGSRTVLRQFAARTGTDVRYVLKSPVFLILLAVGVVTTLPGLMTASGFLDGALHPITSVFVPTIEGSFSTILLIIATYYGGELVWRERERKINEIIDAAPLPSWAFMLPKMLGLAIVLLAAVSVGMVVGVLLQLIDGSVEVSASEYLLWYLLPNGTDAILIAVFAIFVQALSASKYAGWGVMVAYILLLMFGPALGLEYPLFLYGRVPGAALSDMAGIGNFAPVTWWFRLFWAATATLLLVAVHLLWPRGVQESLSSRLRRIPARLGGRTSILAGATFMVFLLSGGWILYNTLVLNDFRSPSDTQRYLAEYEKRFFRYASLPQPAVEHVDLDVALYPEKILAEVRGRYRLVNRTSAPVDRVHVRLMNQDLRLVALDFPSARLEENDDAFGYRIYRLDKPMHPGEARSLTFHARRQQIGFRATGTETGIVPNGTDLSSLELTPRIGMTDVGLIEQPTIRRKFGLPQRRPLPRLDDLAATKATPSGDAGWTTADITISTVADQTPIAPGTKVSERVKNGRRTARFVSSAPIKNHFSIQSGRYTVRRESAGGVEHSVYFHPAHFWNIDRMMTAMRASIDYYNRAFGPYQFAQARIVERPDAGGGQAFPNTIAVGEGIFPLDLRNPDAFDAVTMLTAHELAHQWWGHQVLGARMQGAGLLYETLAQYSALMVVKQLRGEEKLRPFFQFQRDRYLSGRRAQALAEQPLASVEISQQHIAYGKGALAFYLLQQRMGEAAMNRALGRFVSRYRFTVAPYPRSVDLIAMLRDEAKTPELRALITDLLERITLYNLRVVHATAVRRADRRWKVTVQVAAGKVYADGSGNERQAPLHEPIEIGLFAADPDREGFSRRDVLVKASRPLHSGLQLLHFVTDRRPTHVGVDPSNLYIDRNAGDNVRPISS